MKRLWISFSSRNNNVKKLAGFIGDPAAVIPCGHLNIPFLGNASGECYGIISYIHFNGEIREKIQNTKSGFSR